jgi:hypothetical protein
VDVRVWLTDLSAAWFGERLSVRSHLPFEATGRWLGSGVVDRAPGTIKVCVRPAALNPRSVWRPVLRGRLVPDGDGCRFDGMIGCERWLRAFVVLWVGGVVAAALGTATYAVVEAARDDGRVAEQMVASC